MATEAHAPHREVNLPPNYISRPLGTIIVWEPKKATKPFSPAQRIGALSDDLVMMEKDFVTKDVYVKRKLNETAKIHAERIITANRSYQHSIARELEILFSIEPDMAAKTSDYLINTLEDRVKSSRYDDRVLTHYQHIADRLGLAAHTAQHRRSYLLAA